MVLAYLVHNGHSDTALMFSEEIKQQCDLLNVQIRNSVSKSILNGRVGDAIRLIEASFPNLLGKLPKLLFLMRSQQFVEKVLKNDSDMVSPADFLYNATEINSAAKQQEAQQKDDPTSTDKQQSGPSLKLTLNRDTTEDDDVQMYDIFEAPQNDQFGSPSDGHAPATKPLIFPNMPFLNNLPPAGALQSNDLLQPVNEENLNNMREVLVFGHLLYQAGVYLYGQNLISASHYHNMMEVFSLIVVDDINSSSVDHLISQTRRDLLAEQVNSAILHDMGYPWLSNIDSVRNQIEQCYSAIVEMQFPISGLLDIAEIAK